MNYSKNLERDYKRMLRQRAGLERRVEKELDDGIERFRSRFSALRKAGEKPISVIAEGDSWFRYVVGFAVIYHLEKLLGTEILNLAKPGDEVRRMLTGKQAARLRKELKRGPSRRLKYDFLLFSGGGNDLVGEDTFYKWLHEYEDGMSAAEIIDDTTLQQALRLVENGYRMLIEIRDSVSKNTRILLHSYDFAYPNGDGVCWLGPWLEPGLVFRKVPHQLRKEVVEIFLRRFDQLLSRIARSSSGVYVVPTQGTLVRESEWDNELHPKKAGFKKMAIKFQGVIENES